MKIVKIYWLEDLKGVPFYVGRTCNITSRANAHKTQRKCGAFKLFIIDYVEYELAPIIESYWIQQLSNWGFKLENKNHNNKNQYAHKPIIKARNKEQGKSLGTAVALLKATGCRRKTIESFINESL